jgi:hypothetical protein
MKTLRSEKGVALIMVIVFAILGCLIAGISMQTAFNESRNAQHQVDSTAALYLAEAGIQRALNEMRILTEADTLPTSDYAIENFSLDAVGAAGENFLGSSDIDILISPGDSPKRFNVQSTATVRGAQKSIYVTILASYPASVFDYVYFINNWGWFYGNGILARGDIRSNGRFDFRENPTVNGEVYAVDEVDTSDGEIRGTASKEENGEFPYQHPGSSKLPMPNLQDLSIYEEMATEDGSTISIGGNVLVNGIYGDNASESGNIVLIGTVQDPIVIDGPVVIRGDVVIKGKITGQGVIYAGRNIYIADALTYVNSPGTAQPAANAEQTWFDNNKDKDLVGYAASENIVFGDYTSTSHTGTWYSDAYLFDMGTEDVGEDGIWGTEDEYENDGEFQEDYEDLDSDVVMDDYYTWNDVYTSVPITQFANVPADVTSFGKIARNDMQEINGILFTNHAIAGRVKNLNLFGAMIGKDEALVYNQSFNLMYDLRIHSKFHESDPDWFIDLGFPLVEDWQIVEWRE